MRIALVDSLSLSPWRDALHRLSPYVAPLEALGHTVVLIDATADGGPPILTGLSREGEALPLIEAVRVFRTVDACAPDLCLVPFAGGLAHGLVMGRACGELDPRLRIALLAEAPSRESALRGDLMGARLRPVVADALERVCLSHADALLSFGDVDFAGIAAFGLDDPQVIRVAETASLQADVLLRSGDGAVSEIVVLAPFERAAGAVAVVDAIERLATTGDMQGRRLVFAGPMTDADRAPGKTWLGRRAGGWPFGFRVHETTSFHEAFDIATRAGTLAVVPAVARALLEAHLARAPRTGVVPLDARVMAGAGLADALRRCLQQMPSARPALRAADASVAAALAEVSTRPAGGLSQAALGLSVCILHRDRPALLAMAIDSVRAAITDGPGGIEIVVLDNASAGADSAATLERVAAMPEVRVERLRAALPVPEAMNLLARAARHEALVFLDDDNVLARGGLARLRRALALGRFDVVTSALEVFDGTEAAPGPTVATMAFIGPAATAGLFFNAFGDTSMAVSRTAFEAVGGFPVMPGPYPAADWIFLAKAQAAGLRIGVLQTPAFRYRRDLHKQDLHWQKFDQHGVRQHLLQVYGDRFDPALVAKLAQSLLLE